MDGGIPWLNTWLKNCLLFNDSPCKYALGCDMANNWLFGLYCKLKMACPVHGFTNLKPVFWALLTTLKLPSDAKEPKPLF